MPRITIDLNDDQHERFVTAKMRRKKNLQVLMIEATEAMLATTPESPGVPASQKESLTSEVKDSSEASEVVRLLQVLEASGREDLVRIADAMLRQMVAEVRGGRIGAIAEADPAGDLLREPGRVVEEASERSESAIATAREVVRDEAVRGGARRDRRKA